jgi:hypothetical protein
MNLESLCKFHYDETYLMVGYRISNQGPHGLYMKMWNANNILKLEYTFGMIK